MSSKSFKKLQVYVDNQNITDTWVEINIYQSLDAPTWSCDLTVIDGTNMLENLPIMHGSKLRFVIATESGCETDGEVEFEFYIYNIGNKVSQNQNLESYTIKGVSKAFLLNNTIRINKRYSNTSPLDIIHDICSTSFPENDVEINNSCENTTNAIINNWTPFISISWVLKQARISGRTDYIFFQNSMKTFTVESIEEMYSNSMYRLKPTLTYKVANTGDKDNYNIIQHHWEHVNVQSNIQSGYYKSTVVSYDFFNKSYNETIYTNDNAKDASQVAEEWKEKLLDNSEKSVISFMPKMPTSFDNSSSESIEKWLPYRKAIFQTLDNERFSAQMKGSIGTWNWLGKNIYIDLPSPNSSEDSNDFYSHFRRGYYLVTAVVHHFTPSMYLNNFEFVKLKVDSK